MFLNTDNSLDALHVTVRCTISHQRHAHAAVSRIAGGFVSPRRAARSCRFSSRLGRRRAQTWLALLLQNKGEHLNPVSVFLRSSGDKVSVICFMGIVLGDMAEATCRVSEASAGDLYLPG